MDPVVLLVVLCALCAALWMFRSPRPAPPPPAARKEPYTQIAVSRNYLQHTIPRPGDNSPLTPWLSRVIDARGAEAPTAGESVPFDEQEVKLIMNEVLHRVNAVSQLQLALVSTDSVRKTVDRFKTLRYEANINVYSKTKAMAAKLLAVVEVLANGDTLVRELRVHGAAKDTGFSGAGAAAPSNGAGSEEKYAAFEPAIRM